MSALFPPAIEATRTFDIAKLYRRLIHAYFDATDNRDNQRIPARERLMKDAHLDGQCEIVAIVFRLHTPTGAYMDLRDVHKFLGPRPVVTATSHAARDEYDAKFANGLRVKWEG